MRTCDKTRSSGLSTLSHFTGGRRRPGRARCMRATPNVMGGRDPHGTSKFWARIFIRPVSYPSVKSSYALSPSTSCRTCGRPICLGFENHLISRNMFEREQIHISNIHWLSSSGPATQSLIKHIPPSLPSLGISVHKTVTVTRTWGFSWTLCHTVFPPTAAPTGT